MIRNGGLGFAALAMILICVQSQAATENRLQDIDHVVDQVMERLSFPGLSLAVVQGDKVLLAKGYGVRELGRKEVVNARTLFALGSVSKAFTATALGVLVAESKVEWDAPIVNYLPGFRVLDPYVTLNLTLRDALSHRTGLNSANGLMMANTRLGRKEMVARLAHLDEVFPFRSRFLYNNLMYIAASEVIPAVTGRSWEEQIKGAIFDPLKMSDSIPNSGLEKRPQNSATPHESAESGIRPISYFDMTTAAPAGGILSNAKDMAQWCRAQLNDGKLGGEQRLPAGVISVTQAPVIGTGRKIGAEFDYDRLPSTYGMGWGQRDYRRRLFLSHRGGIDGMASFVSLLPEEGLCVVTLANISPATSVDFGHYAIHNTVYDRFLAGEAKDWIANLDARLDELQVSQMKQAASQANKKENTTPSLPLEEYVATYHHPLNGNIVVSMVDGVLRMQFGGDFKATLKHWHFDTFHAEWDQPGQPDVPIQFVLNTSGKVGEIDAGDRYKRTSE